MRSVRQESPPPLGARRRATLHVVPDDVLDPAEVWDRHGTATYALACALLGDEATAIRVITLAMVDLVREDGAVSAATARPVLARHVYLRSQEMVGRTFRTLDLPAAMVWLGRLAPVQRACLALCVFGGLTHHETAELLDLPPMSVAELLTAGLRDLSGWPRSTPAA